MVTRNKKMCYSRYRRLVYHEESLWTEEQEKTIVEFVKYWLSFSTAKIFPSNFIYISIEYSARQIQHYYEINLKPDLRKTDWNIEEDLLLIKLI